MIPTTQAIIDAIEQRSRTFKARWLKSLDPVEELSCNIMSLTVTTGGGGETPVPGALFSSYVNCTVMNLEENIKGFDYYLQIGVVTGYDENDEEIIGWLPSNGKYTVIKTGVAGERTEFMAVGAITAKCQKAYVPTTPSYRKTIRTILDEIQTTTGCTITIKEPLLGTGTVEKPITGQTCAGALSTVAALLGGFVTEDYQGNIVIAAFGSGSIYPVDLTRFSLRPIFTEDPFTVTGLTCNVREASVVETDGTSGGDSGQWEYIIFTPMTGRVYNAPAQTLNAGKYETGDEIGFDVSWNIVCTEYAGEGPQSVIEEKDLTHVSFTYGTAQTAEVAEATEENITVTHNVVYDGANTFYAQTIVTCSTDKYTVSFGISTGPAHYYIIRYPEISFSSGTPNITIENEYMNSALFYRAAREYRRYSFTPATLPLTLGNPRLEPWDVLEFTEGDDTRRVPCHMLVTTFTGGLWQDISSLMAGASDDGADPVAGSLTARIDQIASASQVAQAMATSAQTSANTAATAATEAQVSAGSADQAANFAAERADDADREATRAGLAADEASGQARIATQSADSALVGLATVQDVVGVLNWITEHGTMTSQSGGTFDSNQVYFVQDTNGDYTVGGTRYSLVAEPKAEDINSYYVLSVDKSVQNYVATHIVVDSEGLWIVPDGTTATSGYKVLIATGGTGHTYPDAGTYIIGKVNGVNKVIAKFLTSGITIGEEDSGHIVLTDSLLSMAVLRQNAPVETFRVQNGWLTVKDAFHTVQPAADAVLGFGYDITDQYKFVFSGPEFAFAQPVYMRDGIDVDEQTVLYGGSTSKVYAPGTMGTANHEECPLAVEGGFENFFSVVVDPVDSGGGTCTSEIITALEGYRTTGNVDKTIYDALNSLGWLSDCVES